MKTRLSASNSVCDLMLGECEQNMQRKVHHDEACLLHLKNGGSRTRAKICISVGQKLQLNKSDIVSLSSLVELLHNASLIHDDVQDDDGQRRGKASIWKVFGKSRAICSGDTMITAAFGEIADISSSAKLPIVIRETNRAVQETIEGQNLDLMCSSAISSSQYELIAAKKSGPLFRLALSLPLILANRHDLLEKVEFVASTFAIAYQINDDLDDWKEDSSSGDLNLVNILAETRNTKDAIFIAKNRARYLLRKCKQELSNFPNDAASIVVDYAETLMNHVEAHH
uniref:polyprenyl synthetase family protein n=1 Tax=Ningiella ruwaisensis TaxID=2364274 RepID=UPI00144609AE|nr:polyprenyl synthetase family protein [Ningiella ruwaisensis]